MRGIEASSTFVTGASGQIGRALVQHLLAADRPVTALCHCNRFPDSAAGLTWIDGDLTDSGIDLGTVQAGTMIHATGLWMLPRHLSAIRAIGVTRLVAFGSSSIFGKQDTGNQFEQQQIALIKQAEQNLAERCSALGIAWTILRPALTYGAGMDKNISAAARFIERFGFYPVSGPASGLRQPVHAADLAKAAIDVLAESGTVGRCYELGGGETLRYRDMIARIFDALDRPRRIIQVPFLGSVAGAWGRMTRNPLLNAEMVRRMNRDLDFDRGAAARDFGYAPRAFLSGGRADLGIDELN